MSSARSYRRDIDGLRAVAVLPVLLFHLHIRGFGGGFVGVDIFFVISGYLITRQIVGEVDARTFSLAEFYLRRLRRLGPSLIVVLAATSALSMWLLYPEDMRSFARSLFLQFLALQNVSFLEEGEYFRGSDTKLLLHTWSLAVEEQFYLFWPWFLIATRRHTARKRVGATAVLVAASFALNLVLMRFSPKAAFFLLPARAWEMAAGGALAIFESRGVLAPARARSVLAWSGALFLGLAIATFSATTAFPGAAALLPVAGATLLLAAGQGDGTIVTRVLENRVLARVGMISYPLYLWHWPLIAGAARLGLDMASPSVILAILVTSIVLAEALYALVETPIRTRRWLSGAPALVRAFGCVAGVLALFGVHSCWSDGAAYRYPHASRSMLTAFRVAQSDRCGLVFRIINPRAQVCPLVEPDSPRRRVLVWGNSHADMWTGMLRKLALDHSSAFYLNARNCRPTEDISFCGPAVTEAILSYIEERQISDVIFASSWSSRFGEDDDVVNAKLEKIVRRLSSMGRRVWLVVDTPAGTALDPVGSYLSSPAAPRYGTIPLSMFDPERQRERALFERLTSSIPHVQIVDPTAPFCDDHQCLSGRGKEPWYRDGGHLTDFGAELAATYFERVFVE